MRLEIWTEGFKGSRASWHGREGKDKKRVKAELSRLDKEEEKRSEKEKKKEKKKKNGRWKKKKTERR